MNIFRISLLAFVSLLLISCNSKNNTVRDQEGATTIDISGLRNPFIPGYYADPSTIKHEGKYYIFATIDPWGSFELAVWESSDFKQWTLRRLNWPTIARCHSRNSDKSMLSAPSVVKADDGKFYMYLSAGGEIWAANSDHPLGPWHSLLPDRIPLIPRSEEAEFHNGSAACFIDEDGQAYLFWGSGHNWQNGKCFGVKLNSDMCSFMDKPIEITPPNYLEAPFVLKNQGAYFMFYSEGRCIDSTSKIRYATSASALGPWAEGQNSPLVISNPEKGIKGPGHPSVFAESNRFYLIYHAITESKSYSLLRQFCIDELVIDQNKRVDLNGAVLPISDGKPQRPASKNIQIIEVSSELSPDYPASAAVDNLSGSLWVAADDDASPHLVIDLGESRKLRTIYLWFEYSLGVYQYLIEYSANNRDWEEFVDAYDSQLRGGPRFHTKYVKARYFRMTFSRTGIAELRPAIWEIDFE